MTEREDSEERYLLSDEPIDRVGEDRLRRQGFVEQLVQILTHRLPESSLVIAVSGRWGEGKSSVLHMLSTELSGKPGFAVAWFQPWHYESLPELVDAFFESLEDASFPSGTPVQAVKQALEDARSDLRRRSRGWTGTVSAGIPVAGGSVAKASTEEVPPSLNKGLTKVSEALLGCDSRLLVFTEDLDRLGQEQARRFFNLLFSIRQSNNLTLLLPLDMVQMRKLLHDDAHLLERLIDVDIPLPAIEASDVQDFVLEEIQQILTHHEIERLDAQWERFETAYVRAMVLQLETLREAKRWLNAADIALSIAADDLDWVDMSLLQALRLFFPEQYGRLDKMRDALVGGLSLTFSILPDDQAKAVRRKRIADWLALGEAPDESLTALLDELLPQFRRVRMGEKPDESLQLAGERRFGSSHNFDRFLLFRPESRDVPFSDVAQLWESLEGDDPGRAFTAYLDRHLDKGLHTFDRLLQQVDQQSATVATNLCTLIARSSDRYDDVDRRFMTSQTDRARVLLYASANLVANPQNSLAEAVKNSPSWDFAASIVPFLVKRGQNHVFDRWDAIRVDDLQAAFGTRLKSDPTGLLRARLKGRLLAAAGVDAAGASVKALLAEGTPVEEILGWFVETGWRDERSLAYQFLAEAFDPEILVQACEKSNGDWARAFLAEHERRHPPKSGKV